MTYILLKDRGLLHLNQISVNYFYFLDLKLVQFRYFVPLQPINLIYSL